METVTDEQKNANRDDGHGMGAALENAERAAGNTLEKAREVASNAAQNVAGAAAYVGHKAEEATSSVGNALENTGHYLKNDGLHHITADLTEMIKRNPVPAMLLGIGLGFLFAQATSRRNA